MLDRLVVIGASAGGVEALRQLIEGLPAALPAAVLVAVHLDPGGDSRLAQLLDRHSSLRVRFARTGDALEEGTVLLAPPDHHLLVSDNRVRLSRGPRVNRQRPAVDTLFRSAALARGPGVVAVVLSGALDDGAVGAATVAAQDGVVLVQDPADARVPGMPAAALASVRRARSASTVDLSAAVVESLRGPVAAPTPQTDQSIGRSSGMSGGPTETTDLGTPAALGCPECQGGMYEHAAGETVSYICHVGHTWSAQTLLEAERQTVEAAVYNAASKLLEMAAVHRRLAEVAQDDHRAQHLREAEAAEARAARIQELATEDPLPD